MTPSERELLTVSLGESKATMYVPADGHIARQIRARSQFYEPGLLGALRALNVKGTYVDVGAHIGNHAVFFASACPSTSVVAVEPNKQNLRYLEANAARFGKISVAPVSVSSKADDSHTTLDKLLADAREVALVKIDVGKGAVGVLDGAKELLAKHRPVVAVEAATDKLYEVVQARLSTYGYAVVGCYNPTPTYVFVPVDIVVNVVTYNRPLYLERLLRDLGREPGFVRVRIYEDASSCDQGRSLKYAKQQGWPWHRFGKTNGKRGFWRVVTKVMQDAKKEGGRTMFVFLPDDVRLCDDFAVEALRCWNSYCDPKRVALNLQAEHYRDRVPCWTGYEPKRINKRIWRTQWVDGVMLCGHRALRAVDYRIPEPPKERWKNPTISSGVWQYFSLTLHKAGFGIYRSHDSLVAHLSAPSLMHGNLRKREPIRTARFKGGVARHTKLVSACPIEASLATIPGREQNLRRVVASLLPQVHVLRVYLNGHAEVPDFLRKRKGVRCVLSQKHGDRGDAGKFFWCEVARGYQIICDDDLVYPEGYAGLLIDGIERYNRKAVVGLHGIYIDQPVRESYYRERRMLHWRGGLARDAPVHLLGTGVLGYHASAVKLKRSDFERKNMADIWMGLVCQRQHVPMICLAHPERFLQHLESPWTIYGRQQGRDEVQTKAVQRVKGWRCWMKKGGL